MEAFTQRSLNSPRFVRRVAKFVCKNLKGKVDETKQKARMTNNLCTIPESPSSLSKSPDEAKYRKHARHRHARMQEALRESKVKRNPMRIKSLHAQRKAG